jgi:hypothetical protein
MGGMKLRRLNTLLGVVLFFVAFGLFCGAIIGGMWLLGIEKLPPGHPVQHIKRL